MTSLNEHIVFQKEPAAVRQAFVKGAARRISLPAGTRLYKFTDSGVVPREAARCLSPWWAAVDGVPGTKDPGLDGHLAAARQHGCSMMAYARDRFAVMLRWNALGNLQSGLAKVVIIALRNNVCAFGGVCNRMREEVRQDRVVGTVNVHRSPLAPPIFAGGAYQLYIPNLTLEHAQPVATHLIH